MHREENNAVEYLNLQADPEPENESEEEKQKRLKNWHEKLEKFHDFFVSLSFDDIPK